MIVQELVKIQDRYGYLPKEELEFLALRAQTPLYRIQELATFFPHFRLQPPPHTVVQICRDMACHLRGAADLVSSAKHQAETLGGDAIMAVEEVSCLGRCDQAPVACLSRHGGSPKECFHDAFYGQVNQGDPERDLARLLAAIAAGKMPPPDVASSTPPPEPWQIDVYDSRHDSAEKQPYAAVKRYLEMAAVNAAQLRTEADKPSKKDDLTPEQAFVIHALTTAGLVGMGGAAARTGKKWSDVLSARGDTKYIVCNGDESEPGTFKDRELLLRAPHLVIEGMLLAGLLLPARRGYLYIRHEYGEHIEAVRKALERARNLVPEAFRRCPLEVVVSPGRYICGEETALLEVLEDRRAQPRNTPPLIRTNGLFDKPTLVNNVETFAWLPAIVLRTGGQWYKEAGLRFFSISGDVRQPGVFETSVSATLRDLIEVRAGGLREGMELHAVAASGPSGGFLPRSLPADRIRTLLEASLPTAQRRDPGAARRLESFRDRALPPERTKLDILDLPLDVALFRATGLMLGAGIVVYGKPRAQPGAILSHALNCLEFFERESCGKCVPCRLGCQQLVGLTKKFAKSPAGKLSALADVARPLANVMELTSICGLGRVAANPLTTLLDNFTSDLEGPTQTATPPRAAQ